LLAAPGPPASMRLRGGAAQGANVPQLACHLATFLGAATAGGDALIHVADPFAVVGAGIADFSADPARQEVPGRTATHEIRGNPADLSAISHQPEVLRLGVFAAHGEAVLIDHSFADFMAGGAGFDAVVQIVAVDVGLGVKRRHVILVVEGSPNHILGGAVSHRGDCVRPCPGDARC
jgi:hypothetical protein